MHTKIIALAATAFLLSGCSGLMYRTHEDKMVEETPFWTPGKDFPVMNGDTGKVRQSYDEILARTPSSYKAQQIQKEQLLTMTELEQYQSEMTEEELEEMKRFEHYFETPEQKLYYFRLSKSERANYLGLLQDGQVNLTGQPASQPVSIKEFKRSSDHWSFLRPKVEEIVTGMPKDQVIERWGRPNEVAVAGDPVHENERWSFRHGGQRRIVYFERGFVVGWEQF